MLQNSTDVEKMLNFFFLFFILFLFLYRKTELMTKTAVTNHPKVVFSPFFNYRKKVPIGISMID